MRISIIKGVKAANNGTKTLVQGRLFIGNELDGETKIPYAINLTKQEGKSRVWGKVTPCSLYNKMESFIFPSVDEKTAEKAKQTIVALCSQVIKLAQEGFEIECDVSKKGELKETARRVVRDRVDAVVDDEAQAIIDAEAANMSDRDPNAKRQSKDGPKAAQEAIEAAKKELGIE